MATTAPITEDSHITPRSDTHGTVVELCNIDWFDRSQTFTVANAPTEKRSLSFTGEDLNYVARVLYAEASGSGTQRDRSTRDREKEAILNVMYYRLNTRGYPTNRYIAQNFREVCDARGQFESVGAQVPKLVNSEYQRSHRLRARECSDLSEAVEAVKKFISTGPNSTYRYDNFRAGGSGTRGITIGGTRFWMTPGH